ncbi:hypothetical protein L2Y94_19630 [Luteibacter aegosomatis]|uniref:hypothetical protein n=1 Tax=Luteibacter aegosomatis TaxID=2911537 RepID=UPI001FFB4E03|nr:hypothetical protein [Luteibacter aegosomatis]UPG85487.1 hypothetical protein L2Y94_19630 [Luteibacter aegosomatis]
MKPWCWRLGMALSGLGAGLVSPYLAGASMLYAVDLPLSDLRLGRVFDYWAVLEQPEFAPFAWRMRVSSIAGALPAPILWLVTVIRTWRQAFPAPPISRFEPLADVPRPARRGVVLSRRKITAASVLVTSASGFDTTLRPTLRRMRGPTLYVGANPAQRGMVARFAPFDRGLRWNPFTEAWTPDRLRRDVLHSLAQRWYPPGDQDSRLLASHLGQAFVALVGVVDDVLREAKADIPPAPGDVYRFAEALDRAEPRPVLDAMASLPMLSPATREGMRSWLSLDEVALGQVCSGLIRILRVFGDPTVDAATRGNDFARIDLTTTVWFAVPEGREQAITPLLDAFMARWRHRTRHVDDAWLAIHTVDAYDRLPTLLDSGMRCLATVRRLSRLRRRYGRDMPRVWKRFPCVVLPRDSHFDEDDENALSDYHRVYWPRDYRYTPVRANDFAHVHEGDQLVLTPSSTIPVRCRVPKMPPPLIATSPGSHQGDAMPFPQPLAAVLASLVATADMPPPRTAVIEPLVVREDRYGNPLPVPLVMSTFGPHRFRFPRNLYGNGQSGQDRPGEATTLSVQWPSLQPLPMGVDYHDTTETFISEITIRIEHLGNMEDEAYFRKLNRSIEPLNPKDPLQAVDPAQNLGLRIKAEPIYGLVPYLADFDKLKTYYEKTHGSAYPAADPRNHEDWYLRLDERSNPTTVIKCGSSFLPDGSRVVDGKLVDRVKEEGRRSICDHEFLVPEYKVVVWMTYSRSVLFDWERIERHVRTVLKNSEIR